MSLEPKEKFMRAAIDEATTAREKGDYAIGAVVACGDEIIARGTNRAKLDKDSTAHAEMVVIREASKKRGTRYLEDCVLYTTHEPCPMCAAAAVWAKMEGVVSGARMEDMADYRLENGNKEWTWRTIHVAAREVLSKGEPQVEIVEDFMRDECCSLFHSE